MNAAQLINQTSGKTEWYTPADIVKPARTLLGGFDLDPASSPVANLTVQARRIFQRPEPEQVGVMTDYRPVLRIGWGGLAAEWHGRVWMNHPFGTPERACRDDCTKKTCRQRGYHIANDQPGNEHWVSALIGAYRDGRVPGACCIVFASVSEKWFRPLLDFPILFPNGRINYIDPETQQTTGATKGSCVVYLGTAVDEFARLYAHVGRVMVPHGVAL